MSETSEIDIDGAVVRLGDGRQILVQGPGGHPASLDHISHDDGYAAYKVGDETVTLQFTEVVGDE